MIYDITMLSPSAIGNQNAQNVYVDALKEIADKFDFSYNLHTLSLAEQAEEKLGALKSSHAILTDSFSPSSTAICDIAKRLKLHTIVTRYLSCDCDVQIATNIADSPNSGYRNNPTFGREAYDTLAYSELEIERTARVAFESAQTRRKLLTLIDKADTLLTSKLWRKIVTDINEDYPDVHVQTLTIDEAIGTLAYDNAQFDVVLSPATLATTISSLLRATTPTSSVCCFGDTTLGIYSAPPSTAANAYLALSEALRNSFDMQDEADYLYNKARALI